MSSHNQKLKEHLLRLVETKRVPTSLLWAGPSSAPHFSWALETAQKLVGGSTESPDLHLFYPEGKLAQHSIDSIRTLKELALLSPYQAECKCFLIYHADKMAPAAGNALLKTLEEPLDTTKIFLLSHHPERIMPTLLSRCQRYYFQEEPQIHKFPWEAKLLILLSSLPDLHPHEVVESASELAAMLDEKRQPSEKEEDETTPWLASQGEKKREGETALSLQLNLEYFLSKILDWFRDLHVLRLGGSGHLLALPSHVETLSNWLDRALCPPMNDVEKLIHERRKHFERSAPLPGVLQGLFLSLKQLL